MVRVLIVTDVRGYRGQLAAAVAGAGRVEVAGAAEDVDGVCRRAAELEPEVALLDVRMPGAFAAARAMAQACGETCVLALGLSETAQNVLEWTAAGIGGWVGRDSSFEELVARVESAAAGELICSAGIASALLRRAAALMVREDEGEALGRLTPRELEVLRLLHDGLSNQEIAGRLRISVATVKNHVHHLLAKLGAHSRGEAASTGRRLGLLPATAARDRPARFL